MKAFRLWVLLLVVQFCFQQVDAQHPSYWLISDQIDVPSKEMYSIAQDKRGFIWVGCESGLFRYNGQEFQPYSHPELKGKSVSGVYVDRDSRLWASTFRGEILCVENGKTRLLGNYHSLGKTQFPHYVETENGGLLIAAGGTVAWYMPQNDSLKIIRDDLERTFVYVFQSKEGILLLGNEGIFRFNTSTESLEMIAKGSFLADGFQPVQRAEGTYYMEAPTGRMYRLQEGDMKFTGYQIADPGNKVNLVSQIGHEIWTLTYDGIFVFDLHTKKANHFFSGISFSYVLQDREGMIWLTTLRNGLMLISEPEARTWYLDQKGFMLPSVNRLSLDEDGKVWFATNEGEYGYVTNENELWRYRLPLGVPMDINALTATSKGILFQENHRVHVRKDEEVHEVASATSFKDFCEHGDSIYFATSAYLFALHHDSLIREDSRRTGDPIAQGWIRDLESHAAYLWYCSADGVFRYSSKTGSQRISWVHDVQSLATSGQEMYALSMDGKLYQFTNDSLELVANYQTGSALFFRVVVTDGGILLCSSDGLVCVERERGKVVRKYRQADGLESNTAYDALQKDGFIWIATDNGLQSIPLNALFQKPGEALIYPAESTENRLRLDYGQLMSIPLEAVYYKARNTYSFEYAFASVPMQWYRLNAYENRINLPQLRAGKHTIHVRVVDQDGTPRSDTIKIQVLVATPFTETWWFYMLIGVSGMAVTLVFFIWRIRKYRQKQNLLLDKQRLENDLQIARLKAIQSQMNPHFIFNALNSIQSFIYQNDKVQAASYLGKFSELVRAVLDFSESNTITLADELHIVRLYCDLEALQLQDEFALNLHVHPLVQEEEVPIPPLLIQPYIENAFKHGLRHKIGLKELRIEIRYDRKNRLWITIEDNGVGRKESAQINMQTKQGHRSFATEATESRIRLLNAQGSGEMKVFITDLYADDRRSKGTRVDIYLSKKEG